jgi:hypothetical protein
MRSDLPNSKVLVDSMLDKPGLESFDTLLILFTVTYADTDT